MGAARRRLRREARLAATQLLKAGVSVTAVSHVAANTRYRRVLDKVVDAMERKLDTGEGPVSVREGLAAIKEIRVLENEQRELADSEPLAREQAALDAAHAKAEAVQAQDVASREGDVDVSPALAALDGEKAPAEPVERLRAAG